MGTKKPRDRRDRTERARQERRDLFQKERDRRRMVIGALARKRAARERARIDNEETALESFSRGSHIPTTSNHAAPGPPSIYTAINSAIRDFEDTGGAQRPTPGTAFQLTQSVAMQEQSLLPGFEELEAHELVFEHVYSDEGESEIDPDDPTPGCALQLTQPVAMQEQSLLPEFEELEAHELAFEHVYSDEGESEIDPDDPALFGDHYPSESEAGEDDNGECGREPEDESRMEAGMEELLFQGAGEERSLPGLHEQKDIDVEVNVIPDKPLPASLVNLSQENVGNPFKTVAPPLASHSDIDTIAQIVCFIVITLHSLAGLTTSWCVFLLKAFVFLLEALGRPDIAGQIPSRLPTAHSYSGIPPYHVTALPVCPTCGDVFPVGFGGPVDCPRCSIPLYEEPLHPTNRSIPNPMRKALVPRIRLPFLSISAQLETVFSSPGIEDEVDWWRTLNQQEGIYRDISDGKIWGEILDAEGKQFFRSVNLNGRKCAPDGELRIGVALAMDWFNVTRSTLSSSYSAAPLSFSILSLPPHQRYRVSNLMLTSIFPGPKEQSGDQVQRCLRPIVNDLYDRWKNGIRIRTPSCKNGETRLVRVVLVAVVCDRPAASKKKDLLTPKCFQKDAFKKRTNESHRRLGAKYAKITSKAKREDFVKKEGTRFSQLSRLPHFDLVRGIVIDPMHNLILGLVKSHFHGIWIQCKILRPNHELKLLHNILEKVH